MTARFPWLKMRKKTDPEIPEEPPIMLGAYSNGEFFQEETPRDRKIRKEILRIAADQAPRHGMDRREFLASSLGMATSLYALNLASGCGGGGGGDGGSAGEGGGDGFVVPEPPQATCEGANEALSGDEFILDLQTHMIEDEETWRDRHPGIGWWGEPFARQLTRFSTCELETRAECITPQMYLEQIFLNSDTTVAVLSGFPTPICEDGTLCTSLIDNEIMAIWRQTFNEAAASQRMVQHCQVSPNDRWELQQANMDRINSTYGNHGWKVYTPWGPGGSPGWWLDDEIGTAFIEKTIEIGEPLICAHKGLRFPGWDFHDDPRDVGPAATRFPEANFVIYHSAMEMNRLEGPYDPSGTGVDRLIKTVEEHGLKGKNVYAELGSVWFAHMRFPNAAQHLIGKLLKHLGEDNVVWGSECLWFGSPEPQIEAFRALQISDQLQEEYGYPALTPEIKAKILGLNAAKIYGIDPDETRCTVDTSTLALAKATMDGELGGRRWAFQKPYGPRTRSEFLRLARWRDFLRAPA